jgi:hypothetical protein
MVDMRLVVAEGFMPDGCTARLAGIGPNMKLGALNEAHEIVDFSADRSLELIERGISPEKAIEIAREEAHGVLNRRFEERYTGMNAANYNHARKKESAEKLDQNPAKADG